MTSAPQKTDYTRIRVERGKHRLFERLYYLTIALAGVCVAAAKTQKKYPYAPGTHILVDCTTADLAIRFPVYGAIELAFDGQAPSYVEFGVQSRDAEPQTGLPLHILGRVFLNFITPIFVEHFETHKHEIIKTHSASSNWPEHWRFGRVVRNAISHNGCIRIDRPNEAPVSWHGRTYSYADNGTEILGPHLLVSDLFLLMLDMDSHLKEGGNAINYEPPSLPGKS
jgi:hypothetical protein